MEVGIFIIINDKVGKGKSQIDTRQEKLSEVPRQESIKVGIQIN